MQESTTGNEHSPSTSSTSSNNEDRLIERPRAEGQRKFTADTIFLGSKDDWYYDQSDLARAIGHTVLTAFQADGEGEYMLTATSREQKDDFDTPYYLLVLTLEKTDG